MGDRVPGDKYDALVEQLRGNNFPRGELEHLIEDIKRCIYNEHRPFCGESDDIAIEAATVAYESIESFQGDALFLTWVMGIARNLIKQRSKKRKNKPEHSMEDVMLAYTQSADFTQQVHRQAVDEDNAQILKWEIETFRKDLDERTRRVIELRHDEGLSSLEIAEIIGEQDSNIRAIISRTHKKLMQVLVESGYAHLAPRPTLGTAKVASPNKPIESPTPKKPVHTKGTVR